MEDIEDAESSDVSVKRFHHASNGYHHKSTPKEAGRFFATQTRCGKLWNVRVRYRSIARKGISSPAIIINAINGSAARERETCQRRRLAVIIEALSGRPTDSIGIGFSLDMQVFCDSDCIVSP